jgi:DNA repair protein RadD
LLATIGNNWGVVMSLDENVQIPQSMFGDNCQPKVLHDHQSAAIENLRQALRDGFKRPMLESPTASGKTVIAASIALSAITKWFLRPRETRKAKAVYFMVNAKSLIKQTFDRFVENGIPSMHIGMLGDGKRINLGAPILISTWQSLTRREVELADLVIIDEAHSLPKFYREWMAKPEWAKIPFVGLSATPWTDGLGLFFDTKVTGETTKNLIEKGKLSPFRVYAPSSHLKPDLEGIKTVKGDHAIGELADRMSKPELIADALEEWLKRGEGRPTLCFAVNRAHAMKLENRFKDASIRTGYIDMNTPIQDRERIGRELECGSIQVVFNVNCLTTGVDWPFVSCVVLCRPTKQEHTYVQIVGRGLRTFPGKIDCIIIDHSDTTVRLGLVSDISFDDLDKGKNKESKKSKKTEKTEKYEALPKECICGYIKPVGVRKCPDCGFEPQPQSHIGFERGELEQVHGAVLKATKAVKQAWFSMLRAIALGKRGVSNIDGWVANKFKSKFGTWPRALSKTIVPPTLEVINYVRHLDIAWANRKGVNLACA